MAEKSVTGRDAWSRLFSELTSAIRVELAGEDEAVPLDARARAACSSPDRETRRSAAEAVTAALAPGLRTRAYIFNTLLQDKATDDRLRSYPTWLSSRNLSNEASDESVRGAARGVVEAAYDLPRRWYRLKAQAARASSGSPTTTAPPSVADDDEEIGWDEGRERRARRLSRLLAASSATSSSASSTSAGSTRRSRPGKRGGAFCAYTVPSVHPYVMLNWTSRRRDVMTLAHELGHGVHAALAIPRGIFEQHTPLTVCRDGVGVRRDARLQAPARGRRLARRRGCRCSPTNIEDTIATVFRQIAMNRFEDAVAHARAARRASCPSSASASSGPRRRPSCSATPSRSPTATARGGPTSRTSSARPATSTPTPTGSCSRCRSTGATSRRARRSSPPTWRCSRPAARAAPRSSPRSPASTSPIRASGSAAWTSSAASSRRPRRPPRTFSPSARAPRSRQDGRASRNVRRDALARGAREPERIARWTSRSPSTTASPRSTASGRTTS